MVHHVLPILLCPAAVIANKVVAADSAGKALGSAAGAVGSLLAHNTGKDQITYL